VVWCHQTLGMSLFSVERERENNEEIMTTQAWITGGLVSSDLR